MGDLALSGDGKKAKKKIVKKDNKDMELKVERQRANAAEARIAELENAPVLLTVLDQKDLANISMQKRILDESVEKANMLSIESADANAVVIMLHSAYNATWVGLQKKHGLPEEVDVDWTTGEIFRKKVGNFSVDKLAKDE